MNFKAVISRIFLLFFAFSISVLFVCFLSERVAYILNFSLAFYLRRLFAALFSPFGFSLFEVLAISSPMLIFLAVLYISRAERKEEAKSRFILLISIFSLLPSSYIFTIAIPNISPSPLEYSAEDVTDEDYVRAAKILADGVNDLSGRSYNTLSYDLLSDSLTGSYSTVCSELSLKEATLPKAKPICFSRLLSYTGALAFYAPFGEACINTEIPSYMTPFTVAHEYAHFIGIGGDGDANLLAFILCEGVDNLAVRYSARLVILEYILSDLYKIDKEMYTNIYNSLNAAVKEDIKARREYSESYELTGAFSFFDRLNTAHGAAWDGDGKKSYSVTALKIAAFLKANQM